LLDKQIALERDIHRNKGRGGGEEKVNFKNLITRK